MDACAALAILRGDDDPVEERSETGEAILRFQETLPQGDGSIDLASFWKALQMKDPVFFEDHLREDAQETLLKLLATAAFLPKAF